MTWRSATSAVPFALAAAASGAAPASTGADQARASCVAPDVVGVTYDRARSVLLASGCAVATRQQPASGGELYTPPSPDPRQLVGSQSPKAGRRAATVTLRLKPLCAQPAAPGPDSRGASSTKGPAELVAGLFVAGGPLELSSSCRHGTPAAGRLTVTRPDGTPVSSRSVRAGRYAVFPLKPGRYLLSGTFAGSGNRPTEPQAVVVAARRTTHLDVVEDVP